MTPLPEPIVKLHGKEKGGKLSASRMDLYTPDQMRAYGAAEYKRGIEDGEKQHQLQVLAAIYKLGEKS